MIGRVFLGRYETRRLLGEGGMGRVNLAPIGQSIADMTLRAGGTNRGC